MPCQLPYDCLNDILEYFDDDKNTLYSCLLVNQLCCEIAVKILWRNVCKFCKVYFYDKSCDISTSIITSLIGCLPKESKNLLNKNGINITIIVQKPPLFNYASFCKVISLYEINSMIQHLLRKKPSTILESSENGKYLLSQEILKMLMNQISSLKVLDLKHSNSGDIKFIYLPEAKIHLENLTELQCDSDICSELFYQMTQLCHNVQSLTIVFESQISNLLTDLISSQNNLKIVNFQRYNNYDDKITTSLIKHSLTLTKLTLYDCNITLSFIAMFKNLQELHIDLYIDESAFDQLQYVYFSQLKILKIKYVLERINMLHSVCHFLEINGKNLTEFCIPGIYCSSLVHLTLAKHCPNLKILYSSIMEEESLKLILNNCQYLEIIELCYKEWHSDETFIKILANYSQKYFYSLILNCHFSLQINKLLQDLEEFSINWQNHISYRSFSLIIFTSNYCIIGTNMEDIKIAIDKYIKLGIIKKFEIKTEQNFGLT
ncbi:unnamed protein product [Rhizophagus irregularis]|uniref:F-box domain-containing protein n=1 Tax=Rhizophagus irregularis TaxID=588596 RepID=A0A2I1GJ06_9GLOM|nr:hypothetical protein RhiirA4_461510 [Rhizophagus irregularis]CAB4414025.1 unnamed protein product [Rhizophagus irregularis]